MAFDPVPWFVGGGAEHSPEVARTFAYAATGGAEGVVQGGDLKVTATATPSASVQVSTGAVIIVSRASAQASQSYIGRVSTADTVSIAATSASGPRTDLIVAQVEDPWLSGEPWQDPADPTVGPYIFPRVISNVPANTTQLQQVSGYEGRTAVTLARVTVPASTSTITQAMITDLRNVAQPRRLRIADQASISATSKLTSSSYTQWPGNTSTVNVSVPTWATKAVLRATVVGAFVETSAAAGQLQARVGTDVLNATRSTYYNEQVAGDTRKIYLMEDTITLTSAVRGTVQPLLVYGTRSGGSGGLRANTDAQIFYDIEFIEST